MNNKSRYVILIDFGSTYTKLVVADLHHRQPVLTDHFPSTVATDARIGLEQCFQAARSAIGDREFEAALKLSSSSAAGGLRMAVVGISKTLSLQAGKIAAFGAGAKILKTYSGRLKEEDLQELSELSLEIILFCGGYEKGNTTVLLHNATALAQSNLRVPIIYAGNSAVAPEVRRLFVLNHKEHYTARNIIPEVGTVDKEPVEEIIRHVFLKRIINMKGLEQVSSMLDRMVMPTPAAVLRGGELLSQGTGRYQGLGDLMIIDVGGATTDIHSYARQLPYEGAKIVGATEPYAKRTVEGDLGLRESAGSLAAEIGLERICREANASEEVRKIIDEWSSQKGGLAQNRLELAIEQVLARGAVQISARRHAGWIERTVSSGRKTIQHGKNLTGVQTIIGTGGPLVFANNPAEILSRALRHPSRERDKLLPEKVTFYLDQDYVFFAGGLLREVDEGAAFLLMKNSLKEVF